MKAISMCAVFLLMLATAIPAASAGGDPAAGKDVFKKHCAICHGPNGEGNGPMAKAYNLTPPALSSKEVQALSDAEIHTIVLKGKGKMKPVEGVNDVDIANVTAFVRTLAKK